MCGILFVAQKDIYIEENKKEKLILLVVSRFLKVAL